MLARSGCGILVACVAYTIASPSTLAAVTTYSDRASFQASATGLTLIDFEGIAAPLGFISFGTGGALTTGGLTFTANTASQLFANDEDTYLAQFGSPYHLGAGDFIQAGNGAPAGLTISLPAGITAVGFDLQTFDTPGTSELVVTFSTGDVFTIAAPDDRPSFFGFTSTTPVASLTLEITGGNRQDTINIDTLEFGSAAVVPEPGSATLLVIAAAPVVWVAMRRRLSGA